MLVNIKFEHGVSDDFQISQKMRFVSKIKCEKMMLIQNGKCFVFFQSIIPVVNHPRYKILESFFLKKLYS